MKVGSIGEKCYEERTQFYLISRSLHKLLRLGLFSLLFSKKKKTKKLLLNCQSWSRVTMLASGQNLLFRRLPKSTQWSSRSFSSQKETSASISSRYQNAALFIIGVPVGWYAYDYYHPSKATPTLHDFYSGSLEWKGKAVKPFTIEDTNLFLRNEQSSHEGPSGSGVQR